MDIKTGNCESKRIIQRRDNKSRVGGRTYPQIAALDVDVEAVRVEERARLDIQRDMSRILRSIMLRKRLHLGDGCSIRIQRCSCAGFIRDDGMMLTEKIDQIGWG